MCEQRFNVNSEALLQIHILPKVGFAGTRGELGVLFSLYMMSYEVSEYQFFQYYTKAILD